MKLTVNTNVIDGKIFQTVGMKSEVKESIGDLYETVIRQVFDTRDQQTIDALISLGWTPPPDK